MDRDQDTRQPWTTPELRTTDAEDTAYSVSVSADFSLSGTFSLLPAN